MLKMEAMDPIQVIWMYISVTEGSTGELIFHFCFSCTHRSQISEQINSSYFAYFAEDKLI